MPDIDQLLGEVPAGGITTDLIGQRMRRAIFGPDTPAAPTSLGRYTLLERIGEGGMGTVWAAWDSKLDRRVALKVLRPELGGGPKAHGRLLREAQALARLAHPNVVAVFDVVSWRSSDDGPEHIVLAMEHVAGVTLREWLDERPRPLAGVVSMFVQAGRGIAAAHAAGVVHRDFKPANVIVGPDGRARVVDFGLADLTAATDAAAVPESSAPDTQRDEILGAPTPPGGREPDLGGTHSLAITHPMQVTGYPTRARAGTPRYMAPEQHAGQRVDGRSDQYALCVALWEAVHERPPFRGDSIEALLVAKQGPPDAGPRRIPAWLRRVLLRGLHPSPAQRFDDMDALLAALSRSPTRRRAVIIATASATVLGAVAIWAWPRPPSCDAAASQVELWDAQRQAAIETAFTETGVPYAAQTWATAHDGIDQWTAAWREGHRDACENHRAGAQSDELFDRRMSCLEERRVRLDALLDVLAQPDADVVLRTVDAVQRLPDVDRCADVVALRQVAPLPEDPQQAALLTTLRGRLAVARAATTAGHYARGLQQSDEILADFAAGNLDHSPTLADTSLSRAEALGFMLRGAEAREELVRAARAAQRAGSDELFARAATELVWELGALRDFHGADDWAVLAEGAVARIGGDPDIEYRLGNAIATLDFDRGDLEAAAARLDAEIAAVEQHFGPEDYRAFVLRTNLGNGHLAAGRLREAESEYGRAIAIGTAALGATHPRVLLARNNRVGVLNRAARSEEAWAEVDQIVMAQRLGLGDAHPDTATSLVTRAVLAGNLGRGADAAADARQAIATLEPVDPQSPTLLTAFTALARGQRMLGDLHGARVSIERALAIVDAIHGGQPAIEEAHVLEAQGEIDVDAGDLAAAEHSFQAMLDVIDAAKGDDLLRAAALHQLANVEHLAGRSREALELVIRARALAASAAGADHPSVARIETTMAEIRRDLDSGQLGSVHHAL